MLLDPLPLNLPLAGTNPYDCSVIPASTALRSTSQVGLDCTALSAYEKHRAALAMQVTLLGRNQPTHPQPSMHAAAPARPIAHLNGNVANSKRAIASISHPHLAGRVMRAAQAVSSGF